MSKIIRIIQSLHEQNVASSFINKLYKIIKRYNIYGEENIDLTNSNIVGEITMANPVYKEDVDEIRTHFPNLIVHADDYYVKFVDPNAEAVCVSLWGDGIGVSENQLRAVTSIPNFTFGVDSNIVDFPEFQYFTGIKTISSQFVSTTESDANKTIKSIILPNSIIRIGNGSYGGGFIFTSIESVVIPDNCIIGQASFRNCKQLKYVTMGYGCEIQADAFEYDNLLETFDLNGALSINTGAFDGCTSLTSMVIPNTVRQVGNGAFTNTKQLTSITFESGNDEYPLKLYGRVDLYRPGVFRLMQNSIKTIRLPKRLTELENNALGNFSPSINFIFEGTTPPSVTGNGSLGYLDESILYVPDEALTEYQTAPGFIDVVSRIKPISEYVES